MSKLNKILLFLIVALLMALGIVLYWQKFGFENPYYAIYLNTGDIYFGRLGYFSKSSLSDVYYIQRNPEDRQNPLSVSKFENSFWGPENEIHINPDTIVWKVRLKKDSELLNYIKNPQTFQQSQIQRPVQSTSSSTIGR
ncbi:hypothetical protein HZB06_00855 [Candidatus Wolfebacteria bacterium]|nr:hypothetical protein [Candidatus Wolfebacteria bacterium]